MSGSQRKFGFSTRQLHSGQTPDTDTHSRALPLYQTTAYTFKNTEHAADLFALKEPGNIYTRLMNPTTDVLEQRIADLEGGIGALACSSGHGAHLLAFLTLCEKDDHIVSSKYLYGGTYNLLKYTLPRLGIETTFVDSDNPQSFAEAIQPNTKVIFGEALGNPGLAVFPIKEVAQTASSSEIPLIIDNTVPSPYLFRPIEWGADIVLHSTTKFINGHGTSMGGMIVDAGSFDWHKDRFANFNNPDPSYHGLVFSDLGQAAFIIKARVQMMRDLGASQAPFNSWLTVQGVETLSLRMERHVQNAIQAAEFLENHAAVSWVCYPGLTSHPDHERAKQYFPKGPGALVSFGIQGGKQAGQQFINSLSLFSHVANIGDAKSLAIHPASTTHGQLSNEELITAGVQEDMIRLSIGLEDIEDILWDLDQALQKAN